MDEKIEEIGQTQIDDDTMLELLSEEIHNLFMTWMQSTLMTLAQPMVKLEEFYNFITIRHPGIFLHMSCIHAREAFDEFSKIQMSWASLRNVPYSKIPENKKNVCKVMAKSILNKIKVKIDSTS